MYIYFHSFNCSLVSTAVSVPAYFFFAHRATSILFSAFTVQNNDNNTETKKKEVK